MEDIFWKFSAIAALVFSNSFFVAAEFALVSIRRSRVDELVARGVSAAKVVQKAVHELDRYIAGTQVGITLASLGLGWIGEPALAQVIKPIFAWLPFPMSSIVIHSVSVTTAFSIITFLHVVLGELVPKSLALQKTEQTALWVARPMRIAVLIFQPLIWSLNGLGNHILRFMRLEPAGEHHGVHSVEELEILVHQSYKAGILDDLEKQMLSGTFRFGKLTAEDVMISRIDMVALDIATPTDVLLQKAANSMHRRIPIYDGSIDNIIGILHMQDLFRHFHKSLQQGVPLQIRSILRPPMIVPAGMHLDTLLEQFRSLREQIALIIDEHSGTVGMVTLQDVVEEIVGRMQNEKKAEKGNPQTSPEGFTLVRGDMHLYELEQQMGWKLEDERVNTIGGYVMAHLQRTARVADTVETPYGLIRVEKMVRWRIIQVALLPKKE